MTDQQTTSAAAPAPANRAPAAASGPQSWSWAAGRRTVAELGRLAEAGEHVCELCPSLDGERLAAVIETAENKPVISADGARWGEELEKAWHLRCTADGRFFALVRIDDAWTVMVEGAAWENRFEFAWNPQLTPDGKTIAVLVKREMQYAVAVDDRPWEQSFNSIREYALSGDGAHVVAAAQVEELPEADVAKFRAGVWGVVLDGAPGTQRFVNVYSPAFAPDHQTPALVVRTGNCDYTVARGEALWPERCTALWEPRFRRSGALLAPARRSGAWWLLQDGQPLWPEPFVQLWHHVVAPDDQRVAAVAATGYGRWTVAVDGRPWKLTVSDMVSAPVFSADSKKVAAAVSDRGRWTIAVDGRPWAETFAMVWDPVASPTGAHFAAVVERDGRATLAINGSVWAETFDKLWAPIWSPDGKKILVRALSRGTFVRQVVSLDEIIRS